MAGPDPRRAGAQGDRHRPGRGGRRRPARRERHGRGDDRFAQPAGPTQSTARRRRPASRPRRLGRPWRCAPRRDRANARRRSGRAGPRVPSSPSAARPLRRRQPPCRSPVRRQRSMDDAVRQPSRAAERTNPSARTPPTPALAGRAPARRPRRGSAPSPAARPSGTGGRPHLEDPRAHEDGERRRHRGHRRPAGAPAPPAPRAASRVDAGAASTPPSPRRRHRWRRQDDPTRDLSATSRGKPRRPPAPSRPRSSTGLRGAGNSA